MEDLENQLKIEEFTIDRLISSTENENELLENILRSREQINQ